MFNIIRLLKLICWESGTYFQMIHIWNGAQSKYSQSRSSVPVANELMNSLTVKKWFCLLIQYSIHEMNNPIFIFSLDSIIECWFDCCFLKIYTFHKSRSEFCFFLYFLRVDRESSAGGFWSSNPNKLLHVLHFATSNQCNRPDLLENTMVKLRSVLCSDCWISILGLCQFVFYWLNP